MNGVFSLNASPGTSPGMRGIAGHTGRSGAAGEGKEPSSNRMGWV